MKTERALLVLTSLTALCFYSPPQGDEAGSSRTTDVVYGHKHGLALTMDVLAPAGEANGRGVLFLASANWMSSRAMLPTLPTGELLSRGYTVFLVMHGSQPRFTIPEMVADVRQAVRFVRRNADDYGISPDSLGATGVSSGGHLALMLGLAATEELDGPGAGTDVSPAVQAVGCFFPPTDFLNYGEQGVEAIGRGHLDMFRAAFDFHELDEGAGIRERITDSERMREIGRSISPITHVSDDDPPTMIIHGDADLMVPLQQSESLIIRLEDAGVPVRFEVKPDSRHVYPGWKRDMSLLADWFDEHL